MSALLDLLDRGVDLPAEYGNGLTNHLPMALHALQELGANAAQLAGFHDQYAARFETRRMAVVAPRRLADWTALRGDWAAFDALRGHFAAVVEEEGATAAVANALPSLWPGVAAAAFHGPIRLAHAVESGHARELTTALAYWAARWQPTDAVAGHPLPLAFDAWFEHFVDAGAAEDIDAPLISLSMAQAATTQPFRDHAARLAPPAEPIDTLARHAARLYAQTRNFTVLHVVTAARAVRVLGAFGAPPPAALWPAVAAALMAAQVRDRSAPPSAPHGWPEVRSAAIESRNDHVIKLVHACAGHHRHVPDPAFLDAARRAVS